MSEDIRNKCAQLWKRYQTVLIVLLAGIALMLYPGGEEGTEAARADAKQKSTVQFELDDFERELSQILSQISGAGETTVMLTLKSGARRILAQDVDQKEGALSTAVVTVGRSTSGQEVVELQTLFPQFQGAIVVASGGGDPRVRLALLEAVASATGLGSDRIAVCKRE